MNLLHTMNAKNAHKIIQSIINIMGEACNYKNALIIRAGALFLMLQPVHRIFDEPIPQKDV